MSSLQQIKRGVLPLLKGSPIIVGAAVAFGFVAYKISSYTTPKYESTAKVKLDDVNSGVSSSNLFKDFDVFANTNKIAAEVEVIKSDLLKRQTLNKLQWNHMTYRVGEVRTSRLYKQNPYLVNCQGEDCQNSWIHYTVAPDSTIAFHLDGLPEQIISGRIGMPTTIAGSAVVVTLNQEVLAQYPDLNIFDHFKFKQVTTTELIHGEIGENLDVTAVDKDVAVIRISFKSEDPQMAADFVNQLAETYVKDYVSSRTGAAEQTVQFIDDQLAMVSSRLTSAEDALENYKEQNGIINTRQETETDLRKLSQLKIQLSNLEMNLAALDSLQRYVDTDYESFLRLAPNFEAFNDLLSTEMVKQIKAYQAERKELLLVYTADEPKVAIIDEKLRDLIDYLKESISNTRNNVSVKKQEVANNIEEFAREFDRLPEIERELVILTRNFNAEQSTFNFLTQKRTEAAIAEAARFSFHRIIQKAEPGKQPISPKKKLSTIVGVVLGLLVSIGFVYLRAMVGGKISTKEELERHTGLPIAGVLSKTSNAPANVMSLAVNVLTKHQLPTGSILTITSSVRKEGKTFVAHQLAASFAEMGKRVTVLDMNYGNPQVIENQNVKYIHPTLTSSPEAFIASTSFEQLMEKIQSSCDIIIIDTPAITSGVTPVQLMKKAHHCFHVVRANYTQAQFMTHAEKVKEEYGLPQVHMILNGVHTATDFSGEFTSSRFGYDRKMGVINRLKSYINTYITKA